MFAHISYTYIMTHMVFEAMQQTTLDSMIHNTVQRLAYRQIERDANEDPEKARQRILAAFQASVELVRKTIDELRKAEHDVTDLDKDELAVLFRQHGAGEHEARRIVEAIAKETAEGLEDVGVTDPQRIPKFTAIGLKK